MADIKLSTDKITVFPVSNKPSEPNSRLLTEYNLTHIVNRLVDKSSFVITSNDSDTIKDQTGPFEFNIEGYYVKIIDLKDLIEQFSEVTSIYAKIGIKPSQADNNNFQELKGEEDEAGLYTGVNFTDTIEAQSTVEEASAIYYNLKLLEKSSASNNWQIPRESKVRFNQWSFSSIDDGDLDKCSTIYN